MKKTFVSIIIPTYNERENIRALLLCIENVFSNLLSYTYEVVIVDDDSPDKTAQEVSDIVKKNSSIRLFVRHTKRGLGSAIAFGIRKSKGEIIIGMDADGNHNPVAIPNLLALLREGDIAVGSRFVRGGGMDEKFRYWTSLMFNVFLRTICMFPIWDNTSGYYAVRKDTLDTLGLTYIYTGYGEYHVRMVYLASRHNLVIRETPVYYAARKYGVSKSKLFDMFMHYIKTAYELSRGHI